MGYILLALLIVSEETVPVNGKVYLQSFLTIDDKATVYACFTVYEPVEVGQGYKAVPCVDILPAVEIGFLGRLGAFARYGIGMGLLYCISKVYYL